MDINPSNFEDQEAIIQAFKEATDGVIEAIKTLGRHASNLAACHAMHAENEEAAHAILNRGAQHMGEMVAKCERTAMIELLQDAAEQLGRVTAQREGSEPEAVPEVEETFDIVKDAERILYEAGE